MAKDHLWIEGLPFPTFTVRDLRSLRDEFVVKDEDVIILSYPKSGTNWMMEIVSLIHTKGDPSWVQSVLNWKRSPWIEIQEGLDLLKNQKGPRHCTSHLPIQLFPKSFFQSKAKAIYIIRNPRDVVVSGYHFFQIMVTNQSTDSFEEYFEWFLQGNVLYGSWFDHVHGWLQMKGKENFLLISYEELQQDLRASVERISQFLGMKLSPEELNSVLKNVSFQAMKENKMSNYSQAPPDLLDHSKGEFLRKGITGDWKNHFTVAQSEAFDKVFQEKMAGLLQGLFPWG